jgi:hypothetical protein
MPLCPDASSMAGGSIGASGLTRDVGKSGGLGVRRRTGGLALGLQHNLMSILEDPTPFTLWMMSSSFKDLHSGEQYGPESTFWENEYGSMLSNGRLLTMTLLQVRHQSTSIVVETLLKPA